MAKFLNQKEAPDHLTVTDNYWIFKSYVFTLLFCSIALCYFKSEVVAVVGLESCYSLFNLWACIEPLTQLVSKLKTTADKGDDYHWAGDNKNSSDFFRLL